MNRYQYNFMQKPPQTNSNFVYTPKKPYLRLIKLQYSQERFEKKQFQYNIFLLPRKQSTQSFHILSQMPQNYDSKPFYNQIVGQIGLCSGPLIQKCQILDSNLDVMIQQAKFKDLQKQSYCLQNQDDFNQEQLLEKTYNQQQFKYLSFPKHRDFHLGRQVRQWKSMLFKKPYISRNHCKFIINVNVPRQGLILQICSNKARRNSSLRKITKQLFSKIQQYLHRYGSIQYKIIDQHSTFGTYIYQIPSFINKKVINFPVKLQQNSSYSFNAKPQYSIEVERIIHTKDFENYSNGVQQIKSWVKKQYQTKQKITILVPQSFHPFRSQDKIYHQNSRTNITHYSFINIRIYRQQQLDYKFDQKIILIGTSTEQPFQKLFPIGINLQQVQNQNTENSSQIFYGEQLTEKTHVVIQNNGINKLSINVQRQIINAYFNDSNFSLPVSKKIGFLSYSGNSWYLCNKQEQLKYIKSFNNAFKVQKTYSRCFPIEYKNNGMAKQRFSHIASESESIVIWRKVPPIGIVLRKDRKYKIRLGTPKSSCEYIILEFIDFEQE